MRDDYQEIVSGKESKYVEDRVVGYNITYRKYNMLQGKKSVTGDVSG